MLLAVWSWAERAGAGNLAALLLLAIVPVVIGARLWGWADAPVEDGDPPAEDGPGFR